MSEKRYRVNYKVGDVYDGLDDEFEYFDDIPTAQREAAKLTARWRLKMYIQDVFIEECTIIPGPSEEQIKADMDEIVAAQEAKIRHEAEREIRDDLDTITRMAQKMANKTGQAIVIQVGPQVVKQE